MAMRDALRSRDEEADVSMSDLGHRRDSSGGGAHVDTAPDGGRTVAIAGRGEPTVSPWTGSTARLGALGLVALTSVVTIEILRMLFSVAYHASESMGSLPVGGIVIVVLAAPVLAGGLRRLLGASGVLLVPVAALAALRVALQFVRPVPFWLVLAAAATAVVAVTVELVALRATSGDGSLAAVAAVITGLGLDTALRATGATWDLAWREDLTARALTALVLVGLLAALAAAHRGGLRADHDDRGAGLVTFLVFPFLYLSVFYLQSPAFIDASIGAPVAVGVAFAVGDAVLGLAVLVAVGRRGAPPLALLGGGVLLAALAFGLPQATGWSAALHLLAAQAIAAALLGAAAGAARGRPRLGSITVSGLAAGGGAAVFAAGTLAFAMHTIQPLPVTNRAIPALMGLLLGLSARARPVAESPTASPLLGPRTAPVLGGALAGLALVAAVGLAITAPRVGPADITTAADGTRPLSVMTFNIEQGTTLGQLDLEQQAAIIERAHPDVVVMEEVARGWSLSGMTDEAEWFARRLGMRAVWSPAADHQFGNLVLSRVPIWSAQVVPLGKGEDTQARSAALVTVDLGDGYDALVIGAHLTNGDDRHATRAASYEAILAAWGGRPRTVLLGDFNTYPRDVPPGWPELSLPLNAGFRTTQDTERCTVPTSNQNCPDWIFTSPDLDPTPVSVVVDRPDHRPITATVAIPR